MSLLNSNDPQRPEQNPAPGAEVPVAEAIVAVANGAWLLDVREQDEWNAVHAPAAHLIPLSSLQQRQDELPSDEPIFVICRSGSRSRMVTNALVGAEYLAVNVSGGMDAWQQAGGPTSPGDPR